MTIEIWKPVPKFENFKVSNYGRIKNNDEIIKTYKRTYNGFLIVTILSTNFYVHRLVAEVFIPNPFKKLFVCHKSENKLDNSVQNLEWISVVRSPDEIDKIKIFLNKDSILQSTFNIDNPRRNIKKFTWSYLKRRV